MNAPDQIPTKPVTLAQLLDRALVHLDTAREDVQAAADSLPNGSKAEHALPQLGEVAHYLREAAKLAAVHDEGMRLLADGANSARRDRRLAELQAKHPPTPEQVAALAPYEALRAQLVASAQARVAAGASCDMCATTMVLPGLPPAAELGPLADPNLVADAAMALTRRLGFDWCGYQVGMHDSKPIPLIKLQGDAKP